VIDDTGGTAQVLIVIRDITQFFTVVEELPGLKIFHRKTGENLCLNVCVCACLRARAIPRRKLNCHEQN
jgi:hypothetical protein